MMFKKTAKIAAGAAAVSMLVVGCGTSASNNTSTSNSSGSSGSTKTVTIGALFPLTGSDAKFGQDALNGINLEAEEINATGGIKSMGGAKIKIVSRDATSNPSQAAAAMQQLISSDHPLAVIGVYASALTITAAPIAERQQVPLLSTGFANSLSSSGYKYFFQIPPVATKVGAAQLNYALQIAKANSSTIKNVAIVYEDDAFGTKTGDGIKAAAKAAGLNVVLDEGYSQNISDATPIANKIAAAKPDVVFPVSYLNDGVLLVRALKQANLKIPIVAGVGGFVTPDFLKLAGKNIVDGVLSTDISSPDNYGKIGQDYQKKYGTFMSQGAHDNAVGLSIIDKALEAKPTTNPEVLDQTLHSMDFTSGLAAQMPGGHVKFSSQGANTVIFPIMVQWQNGKLVTVWPQNIAKYKPQWP